MNKSKVIQWSILALVALVALWALYLVNPFAARIHDAGTQPVFKPTFRVDVEQGKAITVGLIGEGRNGENGVETADLSPFQQLIEALKKNQAKAVFLNGNIVSGVETTGDEKVRKITADQLQKQLEGVVNAIKTVAPEGMTFYPTMGENELGISGAPEVFNKVFGLDGALVSEDGLAYTVAVGSALFVVLPTDFLDGKKASGETAVNQATVSWLQKTLVAASKEYRYLFVVGYEPAFPSTTTFQNKNLSKRDEFWKILSGSRVLAYFSSKEHLFDRSNRNGVWQVISGGGGAPEGSKKSVYPFIHALVLIIPNGEEGDKGIPLLKILDDSGEVVDTFELKPQSEPLFQMRIS